MKIIRANERGYADHGWLKAFHTFSFGEYYNPEKIQFGALRVLNDDSIAPQGGFGMHPHKNMEIITIPLQGSLEHKDSTGQSGIIGSHEVQVMSAGTGVYHSEINSGNEVLNLFQIWILPEEMEVKPRYGQQKFEEKDCLDQIQLVVSPDGRDGSLWIHQRAFISRFTASMEQTINYHGFFERNKLFIMIIKGDAEAEGEKLFERDALLLSEKNSAMLTVQQGSQVLFIEIP